MIMITIMSTAIRIPTPMTTEAVKRLRLQSWFSPAFPIGAFSYSHGLEWAVEEGAITDRIALVAWLDADLRHGSGRMDAMFFAQAWGAARRTVVSSPGDCAAALNAEPAPASPGRSASALSPIASLYGERQAFALGTGHAPFVVEEPSDRIEVSCDTTHSCLLRERAATQSPGEGGLVTGIAASAPAASDLLAVTEIAAAMRGTSELALETGQQGVAFLSAVSKAWPHAELDRLARRLSQAGVAPILPVAAGICCAVHDIGLDLALPLYVHGSAANFINAAVRLIPLGQTDGQIALAALEAAV